MIQADRPIVESVVQVLIELRMFYINFCRCFAQDNVKIGSGRAASTDLQLGKIAWLQIDMDSGNILIYGDRIT